MKTMNSMKKRVSVGGHQAVRFLSVALLSLLMVCSTSVTAFAAANAASLDLERTGSISVTLRDESDNPIPDGTLTIYQVADLILDDGNMAYVHTESFADCEAAADLDVTNQLLAADLAEYVSDQGVEGISESVTEEGSITFSGLGLGLYLVMQTGDSAGYYTAEPFLVTLPLAGETDWEYEVNAAPKMAALTEIPENTTTDEDTTTDENTSEDEDTSESEDEDTAASGSGSDSSSEEQTEDEQDKEEDGTDRRAEQEEESAVVLPGSSSSGSSGTSSSSGSSGTLPQTGQLNWPIPFLAVGGFALIVLGMFLQRKKDPVAA